MSVGFDSGGDDPGLHDFVAAQLGDDAPPRHDDDLVAQPFKLRRVRRIDDDWRARVRYFAQNTIDLGARANINALGRFVGDDKFGFRQQGAGHYDLLLIAAGKRQDWSFQARRLDRQRLERRCDLFNFSLSAEQSERGEPFQSGECRVLAHRQACGQTFGMPIRRHECCFAQKVATIERTAVELNRAFGLLEARQRAH